MSKAAKSKQVTGLIRLMIPAGKAQPAPPLGPALGQKGLNMMEFCKEFNAKTANLMPEIPVPTLVTAYSDRSYQFRMKTPPTSFYLKKAAGLETGSGAPGTLWVGSVSVKHVYEIAKLKQADQPGVPLESVAKQIVASARSIGIRVVREL